MSYLTFDLHHQGADDAQKTGATTWETKAWRCSTHKRLIKFAMQIQCFLADFLPLTTTTSLELLSDVLPSSSSPVH